MPTPLNANYTIRCPHCGRHEVFVDETLSPPQCICTDCHHRFPYDASRDSSRAPVTPSTAILCIWCTETPANHIPYSAVPQDIPRGELQKSCFDPTDSYWEGLFCPIGPLAHATTLASPS
jgi:hypothetical protein